MGVTVYIPKLVGRVKALCISHLASRVSIRRRTLVLNEHFKSHGTMDSALVEVIVSKDAEWTEQSESCLALPGS